MDPLWRRVLEAIDGLNEPDAPLGPKRVVPVDLDFETPLDPSRAIELAIEGLIDGQVHPTHPRYFGLFNPAPLDLSVMADALVAAFNPQLATHTHAQFAVDLEAHLIRAFGRKLGFPECEGTFTSGGAEANTTALLVALNERYPDFARCGARGISPRIYVSAEAHPTISRAARMTGLGSDAVRIIPADAQLRMKVRELAEAIAADDEPLMIVATAGTTSAGSIDPLSEIASVAERTGCYLHVDAAWGGLAALVPELAHHLSGIERADSITFDAHKALSVPMGAGMFITRRMGALARMFADRAGYMPRDAENDPYAHSMQWSRRFIGLKVFLALSTLGWNGYAELLRKQAALGQELRAGLREQGWTILNDTPLPVVCFRGEDRDLGAIARRVDDAWISVTTLSTGKRALRACITNRKTTSADIAALVSSLRATLPRP